MFAVPTQMYQMAEAIGQMDGLNILPLRLIRTGGSLLAKTLLDRVRDNLRCEILNTYGTTESCTAITACHTGIDPEDKWESIGKASYFQDIRIVEVGETGEVTPDQQISIPGEGQLINQGSQCISEYYCTPDEMLSARDGWQFARDVVRVDDEGFIYPIDRVDNLIISGGENMYPQEIEFHLSKHPMIDDVAICGAPDEKWGQVIKALIVRKTSDLTAEIIEKYCLEESDLPRHKRPRVIEFVDSVPRNILGKIDRNKVS
jgi:fatty-acyl-CoA synthase